MANILTVVTVILPFVCGIASYFIKGNAKKPFVISSTVLTSVLTWAAVYFSVGQSVVLFNFTETLKITLSPDRLGCFFALLVSVLWIFAAVYAFEYMKEKEHQNMFFAFYTATYSAVLGISFSGDLMTMYFFYELLTLLTLPLIIQPMTKKAIRAGRKYLYLSLGGSAFAFIGLVLLIHHGGSHQFVPGGFYSEKLEGVELIGYFLSFLGFGVKAAVFPLHVWLPSASVAPTPVTALLHAVAVVKSGVFAIIRVTYYCYGALAISGTWAQYTALIIAEITILYGSAMALKERHFKRRLAYSTVSNISYIIFGAMLLTEWGLMAGLMHFVFHSLTKLIAFSSAGAVMEHTGREYLFELDGLGKKMPVTFGIFAVSALSLTGIPLFACFISKWELCRAALEQSSAIAVIGVFILLISALLTAIYMLSIVIRAFFAKGENTDNVTEANWKMNWLFAPIAIAITISFAFMPQIYELISAVAKSAF